MLFPHQITPFRAGPDGSPVASPRTGRRRLSRLARDIIIILVVKAIVLGLLWVAFFRTPAAPRMTMDPIRVERNVLGPSTSAETRDALR